MVEQAIQMALLPAATYHKIQPVFSRFEEGKLKGQKPRQMTSITLQKALEEKLPRESLLLSCLSLKCFRASRYDLRKHFVLATSVIARFPDLT